MRQLWGPGKSLPLSGMQLNVGLDYMSATSLPTLRFPCSNILPFICSRNFS